MIGKKLLLTTALLAVTAGSAHAEGLSANVGFVTDYVFRGVSQTDESAAVQGGFDYEDPSGFHAGVWGSNIDFNNPQDGSLELDLYAGFGNELGNFSYDVGGIYYMYPGSDSSLDYDFWEVYLALGYQLDIVDLSAGVNYSPEFFGDTGDATYMYLGADVELPHDFSAGAHVGFQDIDDAEDYMDWSLGLGYNWMDFDFSLTYTDTDLDQSDLDEARVVLGVSRTF
jgi:uncharacterized protein (TIGR02001 family)